MINPDKFIPNAENSGNEGLPVGAKKLEDQEAAKLLQKMWDKQVDLYRATQININGGLDMNDKKVQGLGRFEVEISGPESKTFQGKLHPKIECLEWFRGIAVKADADNPNNLVLIFCGWMDPKTEGCTLPPIVYTVGHVPDQTIRMVIYGYTTGISSHIDMLRQS